VKRNRALVAAATTALSTGMGPPLADDAVPLALDSFLPCDRCSFRWLRSEPQRAERFDVLADADRRIAPTAREDRHDVI
jgi:hypothetical protein